MTSQHCYFFEYVTSQHCFFLVQTVILFSCLHVFNIVALCRKALPHVGRVACRGREAKNLSHARHWKFTMGFIKLKICWRYGGSLFVGSFGNVVTYWSYTGLLESWWIIVCWIIWKCRDLWKLYCGQLESWWIIGDVIVKIAPKRWSTRKKCP